MCSHTFLVIWNESWFHKSSDKISITMVDLSPKMDFQLADLYNNKYHDQCVLSNLISRPLQLDYPCSNQQNVAGSLEPLC